MRSLRRACKLRSQIDPFKASAHGRPPGRRTVFRRSRAIQEGEQAYGSLEDAEGRLRADRRWQECAQRGNPHATAKLSAVHLLFGMSMLFSSPETNIEDSHKRFL